MRHRRVRPCLAPGKASRWAERVVRTLLVLAALLLATNAVPSASAAQVYKWVDENGVTHYTTDPETIPSDLRGRWKRVEGSARGGEEAPEVEGEELEALPGPKPPQGEAFPAEEVEQVSIPGPLREQAEPMARPQAAPALVPSESVRPRPRLESPSPRSAPPPPVEAGPVTGKTDSRREKTEQLAELEAQLARDREALKRLVGGDRVEGNEWLQDPELRELARRLPQLQAEIDALRREEQP